MFYPCLSCFNPQVSVEYYHCVFQYTLSLDGADEKTSDTAIIFPAVRSWELNSLVHLECRWKTAFFTTACFQNCNKKKKKKKKRQGDNIAMEIYPVVNIVNRTVYIEKGFPTKTWKKGRWLTRIHHLYGTVVIRRWLWRVTYTRKKRPTSYLLIISVPPWFEIVCKRPVRASHYPAREHHRDSSLPKNYARVRKCRNALPYRNIRRSKYRFSPLPEPTLIALIGRLRSTLKTPMFLYTQAEEIARDIFNSTPTVAEKGWLLYA